MPKLPYRTCYMCKYCKRIFNDRTRAALHKNCKFKLKKKVI